MKIRTKIFLIISMPVVSTAVIALLGLYSFYHMRLTIGNVTALEADRATMIEGDRDAYQAFIGELESVSADTVEKLENAKASFNENSAQAWERIKGPSERFTDDMLSSFEIFTIEYNSWSGTSREVISLAEKTIQGSLERDAALAEAEKNFTSMRDVLNELGEAVDGELSGRLSAGRRRDLENALSLVLNGDRDAYQAYVSQIASFSAHTAEEMISLNDSNNENIDQTIERFRESALLMGNKSAGMRKKFETYFPVWETNSRKILQIGVEQIEDKIRINELQEKSVIHFEKMRNQIDVLGGFISSHIEKATDDMFNLIKRFTFLYTIVFAVSFILSTFLAYMFVNRIIISINSVIKAMGQVASGDLTTVVDINQSDEIGMMADSLREMIDRLNNIVKSIDASAANVTSGSGEISGSAQQLSQGVSEQAVNTEEVSSLIEEIVSTIEQNSENAAQTEKIANQLAGDANKSGESVEKTVSAMKKIAEKISIVEEISRQTNLLALNAAIEAARAGEHGKGFAVVASEVRKLAEHSGNAAGEISELSYTSVKVAEQMGELLTSLVPDIRKTAKLVQEISASSSEQKTGIEQINRSITQLNSIIQQNASSSEELAATSEEMSSQAVSLKEQVSFFKTE